MQLQPSLIAESKMKQVREATGVPTLPSFYPMVAFFTGVFNSNTNQRREAAHQQGSSRHWMILSGWPLSGYPWSLLMPGTWHRSTGLREDTWDGGREPEDSRVRIREASLASLDPTSPTLSPQQTGSQPLLAYHQRERTHLLLAPPSFGLLGAWVCLPSGASQDAKQKSLASEAQSLEFLSPSVTQ